MRRGAALPLLALLLGSTGCHSYLMPFDDRPLPAKATLETESGQRLALDWQGQLVVRPPRHDVGAALGVALFEDESGVVVSNQLRGDTPLQAGDRVLYAAPLLPGSGAALVAAHERALRVLPNEPEAFDAYTPRLPRARGGVAAAAAAAAPALAPAELRAQAAAHPVRKVSDLVGYLCGAGWLQLDLLVSRAGEERVVRAPLRRTQEWVPVRPLQPDRTRWRGVELVDIEDLPPTLRPAGAAQGEVLVTRVARGAPLGRAGLRPLDVLTRQGADLLLGRERDGRSLADVLDEEGEVSVGVRSPGARAARQVAFEPRGEPHQTWFPGLLSLQRDGTRFHLGVGLFDVLLHASSELVYQPTQDRYVESSRWSILTLIQGGERRTEQGSVEWGGINFLVDDSRLSYFRDWFDTPRVVHKERGLEGY
ncbi:MAG: hypothetical protein AB7N76_22995 [Planctomycetota bacterium]